MVSQSEGLARSEEQQTLSRRAQDEALAARLRAGDEQAYAELFRQAHLRIYAFALKRLHDAAEAEDVVQDVFLQVYRSIDKYEGRSSLLTWIFGIAYHEVLRRFRQRSLKTTPLDPAAVGLAAPGASIEDSIDASQTWKRCLRILQRDVTATARLIFELRYARGRSIEAIARQTGKSGGAIRVGLLRTRRALRESASELEQIALG